MFCKFLDFFDTIPMLYWLQACSIRKDNAEKPPCFISPWAGACPLRWGWKVLFA